MKTLVTALAAVAALSTVAMAPAASAYPPWRHGWHHPHPHKVCFFHHGHRVCRWR